MRRALEVLAFVVAAAVPALAWRKPGDTRPNIILFFPDTISAESMGAYGHPVCETPNFDAFAAANTLFDVAISSYPQCSPSRCALATGRHPHVLGHRTQTHLVQPWEQNVFASLKAAGLTTVMLGKNDMLAEGSFNASFTFWEDVEGQQSGPNSFAFGQAGYYSFLSGASKSEGSNATANKDLAAVEKALAFLASDPPEPVLIFLPGIGAHPPYGAPLPFFGMYNASLLKALAPLRPQGVPNKPPYMAPDAGIRASRNLTVIGDEDFSYRVYADYLARVSYTDYIFGRLLSGLDALPAVKASSAVIFSSDHGDFQGNYGLVEKWSGAGDDLLLRVPLAMSVPGGAPGVRVPYPVQVLDIHPTMMELGGLNATNLTNVQFGHSLVPEAVGQPGRAQQHAYVFSEAGYLYWNEVEYNDPTQSETWSDPTQIYYPRGQEELRAPGDSVRFVVMRNATLKLVFRAKDQGLSELYDLVADPRELSNVYGNPAYAAPLAQMKADLLEWYLLTSDVTEWIFDSRNLPPPRPLTPSPGGRRVRGRQS